VDVRFALAVDLGTGGPKVGLVTLSGELAWWTHVPVDTEHVPAGAATQDAEQWWRIVVDATRRGLAEGPVRGDQVAAVAVTGQWASTVPVDADGRPVAECVMWMDTRGGPHSHAVVGGPVQGYAPRALATWVRFTGGVPSTYGADPVGHILHLERDRPDVAARTHWYLEPVDYLTARFTGVPAATRMSMTGAWLTDNRRLDVMQYDPKLLRLAGIDVDKLPPLVPSGSVVGSVLPDVAGVLGISPEAQVITGMPDLHNAAIASGCVLEHEAHMAIGTSSWVSCPVPYKKTDVFRQMASVPGLWDAGYLLGNNQENAGSCLEWFRDVAADGIGYPELTGLAATAPPGAGGVVFTPWLSGERSPVDDRSARAGFHNVSLSTTRADLTRAVLEGVAYNMRWLLSAADQFTRRRLDPIRVLGGGAQSDLWCRILADVCDRTLERVSDPWLAGLRGAAIAAGLALGDTTSSQVRDLVPTDATFRPDPANRGVYDSLYAEFPRLYRAQRKLFGHLNH
jgi:xylulokinase